MFWKARIQSLIPALLIVSPLVAQPSSSDNSYSLKGRHGLSVNVGLLNWSAVEAGVGVGSVETNVRLNGFLGSVAYDFWIEDYLSLTVSAGGTGVGVSADVSAGTVRSETDAVGFVLVGLTYYPAAVVFRPNVLGFVSAAVGPYRESATNTSVGPLSVSAGSINETAIGARVAMGVDWIAKRWLMAGVSLGYHVMADFDRSIGGSDNYSGPEMSVSLGVLLGRSRPAGDPMAGSQD